MKQLFYIKNNEQELTQPVLSVKIGERHASFAVTNKEASVLHTLAYCTAESWNENELNDFIASYEELSRSFYKIIIAYDFSQQTFLPGREYRFEENNPILSSMAPMQGAVQVISEAIPEWTMYNLYGVPAELQQWLTAKFPTALFHHQFSVALKNLEAGADNGSIAVDLRKDDFSVIVARNGKLLLAQNYIYVTPEDVLFHLLNIAKHFSLSQQEVMISLTGLVDKSSSLYNEMIQYFIHLDFREASWKQEEYPSHFFTTLNDLARCAS